MAIKFTGEIKIRQQFIGTIIIYAIAESLKKSAEQSHRRKKC